MKGFSTLESKQRVFFAVQHALQENLNLPIASFMKLPKKLYLLRSGLANDVSRSHIRNKFLILFKNWLKLLKKIQRNDGRIATFTHWQLMRPPHADNSKKDLI